MKIPFIIILLFILLSLVPAYYINKYLQKIIKPREGLGRLVLYMFLGMALIFLYTFFIAWVILKLFPASVK